MEPPRPQEKRDAAGWAVRIAAVGFIVYIFVSQATHVLHLAIDIMPALDVISQLIAAGSLLTGLTGVLWSGMQWRRARRGNRDLVVWAAIRTVGFVAILLLAMGTVGAFNHVAQHNDPMAALMVGILLFGLNGLMRSDALAPDTPFFMFAE